MANNSEHKIKLHNDDGATMCGLLAVVARGFAIYLCDEVRLLIKYYLHGNVFILFILYNKAAAKFEISMENI